MKGWLSGTRVLVVAAVAAASITGCAVRATTVPARGGYYGAGYGYQRGYYRQPRASVVVRPAPARVYVAPGYRGGGPGYHHGHGGWHR